MSSSESSLQYAKGCLYVFAMGNFTLYSLPKVHVEACKLIENFRTNRKVGRLLITCVFGWLFLI